VAELFEVRKPKEVAVLSEIDGYVSISKATKKGKQRVTITPVDVGRKERIPDSPGQAHQCFEGDYVRAGEPLIGGRRRSPGYPQHQRGGGPGPYLVDEVQEVYRLQGVRINDKHIEVIVRQMMRRVKVDAGDTDFILEEQVDKINFEETNRGDHRKGRQTGRGRTADSRDHQGLIEHGQLHFGGLFPGNHQGADRCQHRRAVELRGLKENVIMGRMIPAGTGVPEYRDRQVEIPSPERRGMTGGSILNFGGSQREGLSTKNIILTRQSLKLYIASFCARRKLYTNVRQTDVKDQLKRLICRQSTS
jgi:DNA-directed RNA polymerase subunit beta'